MACLVGLRHLFCAWFAYEFWRFVFVQQEAAKAAQTFIEFPLMQTGASFNMSAVKAEIEKAITERSSYYSPSEQTGLMVTSRGSSVRRISSQVK